MSRPPRSTFHRGVPVSPLASRVPLDSEPPADSDALANSNRITVGLTRRSAGELARLADDSGLSKTDLVNRAISLYALMTDRAEDGFRLAFIGPEPVDGAPVIEMIHVL